MNAKHPKRRPTSTDLVRNPLIGGSKGVTMAQAAPWRNSRESTPLRVASRMTRNAKSVSTKRRGAPDSVDVNRKGELRYAADREFAREPGGR